MLVHGQPRNARLLAGMTYPGSLVPATRELSPWSAHTLPALRLLISRDENTAPSRDGGAKDPRLAETRGVPYDQDDAKPAHARCHRNANTPAGLLFNA